MTGDFKFEYGLSTDLFVAPKPGGKSLVVGGMGEDHQRWTKVLSDRAAQLLWFQLVQQLYPERAGQIKSAVMTAAMREADRPSVTTHVDVEPIEGQEAVQIAGYADRHPVWRVTINNEDANQFLIALHNVLHPKNSSQ